MQQQVLCQIRLWFFSIVYVLAGLLVNHPGMIVFVLLVYAKEIKANFYEGTGFIKRSYLKINNL